MDEHDKIMTENLTKRLVNHRRIGLAAKAVAKLSLNHAESGFDIRFACGSAATTPSA